MTNPFSEYEQAAYEITGNSSRARSTPCSLYSVEGLDFLVLNSAYHGKWTYGRIDVDTLEKQIDLLQDGSTRLAVVHHHCIPIDEKDPSHIVNAYRFLNVLTKNDFLALFHGHRHMSISIKINRMKVIGVGTVSFPPETSVNNQFNFIELGKRVLRFSYVPDLPNKYGKGTWASREEEW